MSVDSKYETAIIWYDNNIQEYIVQPDMWATTGQYIYVGKIEFKTILYPNRQFRVPYMDVSVSEIMNDYKNIQTIRLLVQFVREQVFVQN